LAEVRDDTTAGRPLGPHHTTPNQDCPVGCGIRPALSKAFGVVNDAIRAELAITSVPDLLVDALAVTWTSATALASTVAWLFLSP
jgi:hypothetical protein